MEERTNSGFWIRNRARKEKHPTNSGDTAMEVYGFAAIKESKEHSTGDYYISKTINGLDFQEMIEYRKIRFLIFLKIRNRIAML